MSAFCVAMKRNFIMTGVIQNIELEFEDIGLEDEEVMSNYDPFAIIEDDEDGFEDDFDDDDDDFEDDFEDEDDFDDDLDEEELDEDFDDKLDDDLEDDDLDDDFLDDDEIL